MVHLKGGVFLLALFISVNASATRILSLNPSGQPVAFGGQVVDVSGNGRFAVIQSRQLIPEDNSSQVQVYVLVNSNDQPQPS